LRGRVGEGGRWGATTLTISFKFSPTPNLESELGSPRTPQGGGERRSADLTVAGVSLLADLSGALFWESQRLLVVSDLHLEKGSSFAARGVLLPPYDTVATLRRLASVIARHDPKVVIALGDSFHDRSAHQRLSVPDREMIAALQARRDWIWIAGNHDPEPSDGVGGAFARSLALGSLLFRHKPSPQAGEGEIAGHLHPAARVCRRGRSLTRKCFASDGRCLVMPAFGAYTGGLNVRDIAFLTVFGTLGFTAHLMGKRRLYAFAAARCLAD
jgi:uncharacterized protein